MEWLLKILIGLLFQQANPMQRLLIILGLVIIPFYEVILRMLPFVGSHAPDSRIPKEMLALVFSLSIGLLAVWQGNLKPFRNKWFLIIPVYLLFNLIMSPHADLNINNNEVGDFYFWKPFSEVLCFTFMIIAISSIEIDFQEILKVMTICGTVMAIYVILQKLGLDQFWQAKPDVWSVREYHLGGNLGQPTIVASWIVMMIPLAMYLKKWWSAILMFIGCILTQGAMVISAIGLIWILAIYYRWPFMRSGIIVLVLLTTVLVVFNKPIQQRIIGRMDGRWLVWCQTVDDIKNGQIQGIPHKFPFTGDGFGRFSFTFPVKHNSEFQQAHNDILEFTHNCGLIGGYLLLAAVFTMIMGVISNLTPLVFSILLSFIAIFWCSLGSFPFQLGAHQFYSAILVGFLNNASITRRNT